MDRRSIIGILLIFAILVVFSILNKPSQEEIQAAKQRRDSIARVEAQLAEQMATREFDKGNEQNSIASDTVLDSQKVQERIDQFGAFGQSALGNEEFYTFENNLMKITLSNKGGRIYSVELKNYQTHDSLPLILFDGPKTQYSLNFFAQNRSIETSQLFFKPDFSGSDVVVAGPDVDEVDAGNEKYNKEHPGEAKSVSFILDAGQGRTLKYVYTLKHNSYLVDFDIKMNGLENVISSNQSFLGFVWSFDVPRQEKISKFGEDRYTNIHYKFFEGDEERLSQSKSDEESLSTKVKWIGFKQLFFNSSIIAKESFPSAKVISQRFEDNPKYLANFFADIALPYEGSQKEDLGMQFYFGPNHYKTLNQYDLGLERLVYLGYSIVRPVNKYLIIPVFNFLRKYIANYGIIILLLTIFIKTIVFPFTYKSYVSQAKMRALKPEMDQINEKFGKGQEKAMEKQQAVMALYKKAGVSPMGGCLPMLFQFPFLIAMFFFFPTSIELRQQSFLWAHDLSTYDSILNLPFSIPMYGDHVSLFCLLMTVTTIFSTYLNSQTQPNTGMPGMKTMMYLMPVFFLFLLNNYSSGLSYYYFLANVITIGQTYLIRRFVDDEKIRTQIQVNKKKPAKKSNFQKRLEDMAKQRGVQPPTKKK